MGKNKNKGLNKNKSAESPSKPEESEAAAAAQVSPKPKGSGATAQGSPKPKESEEAVQVFSKTEESGATAHGTPKPKESEEAVQVCSKAEESGATAQGSPKTEDDNTYPPLEKSQTVGTTIPTVWSHPNASPLVKSRTESSARPSKHTSFEEDWNLIKDMRLIDRRALYTCKDFVIRDAILPWSDMGRMITNVRPSGRDRDFIGHCDYKWDPVINKKVALYTGDITALEIDCIVNAANTRLLGGGGVDGAIHRGAGPSLYKQCLTLGGCDYGGAKITYGFNLPANYVIHTVGPMDRDPNTLYSAYTKTLELAMEEEIRSIAFPCIATGVYGYPNDKAAKMAIQIARDFLEKHPDKFDLIVFCLFLPKDIELYKKFMQIIFPVSEKA